METAKLRGGGDQHESGVESVRACHLLLANSLGGTIYFLSLTDRLITIIEGFILKAVVKED